MRVRGVNDRRLALVSFTGAEIAEGHDQSPRQGTLSSVLGGSRVINARFTLPIIFEFHCVVFACSVFSSLPPLPLLSFTLSDANSSEVLPPDREICSLSFITVV